MIGRLNHVAIAVPDLGAARALYRETLGAAVSEPLDLPEHGVTTVFVTLPNAKLELLHPLGTHRPSPPSSRGTRPAAFTISATRWRISARRARAWWRRVRACSATASPARAPTASPCSSSIPRIFWAR